MRSEGVAVSGGRAARGRQSRRAHREMVRDGETGFLATTASEWVARRHAAGLPMPGCGNRWDSGAAAGEADYSVSAWAETFVTSMTGTSRTHRVLRGRSIELTRQTSEAGAYRIAPAPERIGTLNQIGDR